MRKVLAVGLIHALLAALVPAQALAQTRVSLPSTRVNVGTPVLIPALGAGPLSSPLLLSAPSLSASLAPALAPSLAPAAMPVPAASIVPVAAVAAAAAQPAAPKAALAHAAAVLPAASIADKPVEHGKALSEQIFSGAASKESSDDPAIPGGVSDPKPALAPSAPSAPVKKQPLVARWKAAMTGPTGHLVTAAFAWNFLTIAAYSIIGPARGGLLLTKFGPETLPWVYMGSALLTGAVVYVFNRFVKMSRKALIGGSLTVLATTLVAGALAVKAVALPSVAIGYYLWTDVFGIMSTTLFWMYANDVFTHDESKRLFGFIAAGAPLGSIAGAALLKVLVGSMGPVPMLMIAAGLFAAVLPIFFYMEKLAKGRVIEPAHKGANSVAKKGVLKTILSSPFLIALTAIVALERLVPDITNYLYSAAAAAAHVGDAKGLTQLFADVNFYTSLASFAASTLFVGLTLRKVGIGGALMTAGLVNLLLFAFFPFMPTLGLAAIFFGLDGVTRYTWFKTAKESTYAATDHDTLYSVKPVIEMFVYRFARFIAGLLLIGAAWLGGGMTGAALLGIPLALAWLYACWRLGREHKKLEDANSAAGM